MLNASRRGADVVDERAAVPPLIHQIVQRLLAIVFDASVVFDGEPSVLADVAEVGSDGGHAAPTPGNLDHHLGRPQRHGRVDAIANALSAPPDRAAQPR